MYHADRLVCALGSISKSNTKLHFAIVPRTVVNPVPRPSTLLRRRPPYRLSTLPAYYIPRDGPRASYLDYVGQLPATEHPEVFGQHPNADIASQIAEARTLFDTLLSLQPQVTGAAAAGAGRAAGPSKEDKVSAEVQERHCLFTKCFLDFFKD